MTVAAPTRREAKKDDRRRLILAEAERSFFENGYAGTTMSALAATLGGSKATLWNYYPSKEALFEAWLDSKISDFAARLDAALLPSGGIAAVLTRFGRIFLTNVLRADFGAMRLLVGTEGARFPDVARAMYERGPLRVRTRLALYLKDEMTAGTLRHGDPVIAARQFLGLCQAISFSDQLWHRPQAPEADPDQDVAHAVDTFLRGWGTGSPSGAAACSGEA